MVVAMITVRMVHVPVYQVVDMITVGNGLMTATRPVNMARLVS